MFVWLGIALFIDGIDGTFARRLRVAELLPRWSGDVLDLVVDILNYVFVPAYALAASGLLPHAVAIPLGIVIVVTGSLYFADRLMKTSDYYFRGFPALWNVAAFYLFLLKPAPWLGARADRGARGADIRAVSRRASGAHRAFARADDGGARPVGAACDLCRGEKSCSPAFGPLRRFVRAGDLFRRRRLSAPASSVTLTGASPDATTRSSHRRRQPRHRRGDGAACRRARL